MSDAWIGFLGGIVATLVAAVVASIVQRRSERKKRVEQAHLDAYFLLIDLKNWYFWVTTAELHGGEPKPEVLAACRRIAYELNDKIRTFEDVENLDEVLTILFSESISSAAERAKRLDALLRRYGQVVNPKYSRLMERIGRENLLRYSQGLFPTENAPGSWGYRRMTPNPSIEATS